MKRIKVLATDPNYQGMTINEVFEFIEQEHSFDFYEHYTVVRIKDGIVICQDCKECK